MILHLSDFDRYPRAIVDTKTTNETWLRMAGLLKTMGIKNHYFHLALLDPELQGVDFFSPTLSAELALRAHTEIKHNPWFFIREIARWPNSGKPVSILLNRPALAVWWCTFNCIRFGLVMPRQIGKTTDLVLLHNYLRDFYYGPNNSTFLYTKDTKLRKQTVEDMKAVQSYYPPLLSPVTNYGLGKDLDNQESVSCNLRETKTVTSVATDVAVRASNIGRGGKYKFFHGDETAYCVNAQLSIPQIQFAMGAAVEIAEKYGEIHNAVYTTTAGYLDTEHGKYAYDLITSGMYFGEFLYDAGSKEKAKEIVISNSSDGRCMVNGTFNYRQCGKDDAWFRARCADARTSIEEIENNLLNKWQRGSLKMVLTKEQSDILSNNETACNHTELSHEGYILDWWISKDRINERMSEGWYGIGLDSSQAVGRDANCCIFTDFKTMEVIARSRVTEGSIFKYGKWVASLLIRFPNTVLIIENKASGQALLDIIVYELMRVGINPYTRIYNKLVDEYSKYKDDWEFLRTGGWRDETYYENKYKKLFGISTTSDLRDFLYSTVLQNALSSTGHLVRDSILSDELRGLVDKNGRVDHKNNKHDDLVISWLFIHWFIKHSRNLHLYGLDSRYCLSMVNDLGSMLSPEELKKKQLIMSIRNELHNVKEDLKNSYDTIDIMKNERLIEMKVSQLEGLGDTSMSVDSILKEVNGSRKGGKSLKVSLSELSRSRTKNYYANNYRIFY